MTREEQLEIALYAVLSLAEGGHLRTSAGQPVDAGMVPIWQGWRVLGDEARARIEGMFTAGDR